MGRLFRTFTGALVCGALSGGLSVCATNPVTQRKTLNFIPDAKMEELGSKAYLDLKEKETESTNSLQREELVRVGTRIARASGEELAWEFELFDEPKTVNAFCLPGGKIGVYTGILPIAKTEAGLAAILGHEVAHATAKHAAERMSQAVLVQLGLTVADLSLENPRTKTWILGALGLGAQFGVLLPYSRQHESDADRIGLAYMAKAGFDPKEAVSVWERMATLGQNPPEFLSTHPNPSSRAQALSEQLGEVMPLYQASEKQPSKELVIR